MNRIVTLEISECIIYGDSYAQLRVFGQKHTALGVTPGAAVLAAWDAYTADTARIFRLLAAHGIKH